MKLLRATVVGWVLAIVICAAVVHAAAWYFAEELSYTVPQPVVTQVGRVADWIQGHHPDRPLDKSDRR